MEKITTKKELIESLRDVVAMEVSARDSYMRDLDIFTNGKIVRTIKKIKIDEDRHIALLNVLIKTLEGK